LDDTSGKAHVKIENRAKKSKNTVMSFQFSPDQFVPRPVYEQLEARVQAIETKLTYSQENEERLIFPDEILEKLPSVVKKTLEGVMFNYEHDFPEFSFWGMRRALIDAIRIRFRMDGKETMLYDRNGDAYKLSTWIDLAKQQIYISSTMAKNLNSFVKVFGDVASHDFAASLKKEEVPSIFAHLRIALSRMFCRS
jgi:hypothetical protein